MDKNAALCVYLKKYHTGKEKAVPSTELEQLFSLNGRNLRRKINRLRQDGVPICSDRSGYYFAANQEEVNATVFRLMNCTPFVRQYGILSNKWGVLLCQKEYQTNDIRRNSRSW